MRLLCTIIGVLIGNMDRFRYHFPVSYTATPQLIRHDLTGFTLVILYQPPEEALRCSPIPFGLKIYIDDFTILVPGPPQIVLLAVDLHKNFISVESVSVALVPSLQPFGTFRSELDTPEADGFIADIDASFSRQILDIPEAEFAAVIQPNSMADDI
ncbi:MAG TPA: hypothetical protein VKP65_19215 [Rhodothermales bacterium]|nr:hypothetical protein [Rhodothermales bacterium]